MPGIGVRHLGSGRYGDVFSVRHDACCAAMKISYYRDATLRAVAQCVRRGDLRGALAAKTRDAVSVSANFAKFTSRLLSRISPHFVVFYADFDCDGLAEKLRRLVEGRLATLTPAQRRHTNVCFMERCDAAFTHFLTQHPGVTEAAVRHTVFQVLYTLACLQSLLPGFRHNDLSTNNVLVRYVPGGVTATYVIGGLAYRVSGVPVLVALADYDFVHVPNHASLTNERITGGLYPTMTGAPHPGYDAHFFLSSVARCLRRRAQPFPAFFGFAAAVLTAPDRLAAPHDCCTPRRLLHHAYFRPLVAPAASAATAAPAGAAPVYRCP